MNRGSARICTANKTVDIEEGDVFFLPSGLSYHSYWYGEPDIEFISLGFLFLPNFVGSYYPAQSFKGGEEAVALMKRIAARGELDAGAIGEFYTLVSMLLPSMRTEPKTKKAALVDRAKRFIDLNPSSSVSDIARACAVSESALYAAFAVCSDKSINDFKKETVMKKALELLISTNLSVEEISQKLKFSSGAYFRKCFKEYFGYPPREMRKRGGI
jgi:AraC-like DNA-binding protein